MFKMVGSAIIILSATLFGMQKYLAFFERKKTLAEILDGARKIKTELSFFSNPLHEIFADSGTFFEKSATQILEGFLPEEAVKNTASKIDSLKKEDLIIIERFASGLCSTSCEGQLSNLAVFMDGIEKNLSEASAELNVKGKLCVKGSILTAAAIVLRLI